MRYTTSPFFLPADYELSFDRTNYGAFPRYAASMMDFAIRSASTYDVFHFHFGRSLLPRNLDLPILNMLGKSYYFEYHGSEIRQGEAWRKNPYSDYLPGYCENYEALKSAERQLKNAKGAIVHDAEMGLYVPSCAPTYFVPLRMNVEQFTPRFPECDNTHRPKIVHAPSQRGIKGSEYVEAALELLSDSYDFDFILVEGMTQSDAFAVYREADIIIDQLFIGSYGVFALEAMAMGKPVVTYMRPDLVETYPGSLPVVSANKDNLAEVVAGLLEDPVRRCKLGRKSREYVERYHDYRKAAYLLHKIYETGTGPLSAIEAFETIGRI